MEANAPRWEGTSMHNANMAVNAGKMLLVSPSSLTMYQMAKSAHRFDMSVQVCTEARIALELVNRQKFDAVTVDLSLGQQATAILRQTRKSPANRTAVAFAISDSFDESADAFRAGSSFVLQRPLSLDTIRQTLHAARGLILQERRRYFRCRMSVPICIEREGSTPVCGETSDLSEGGMAIRILTPLKVGDEIIAQFKLPGARMSIRPEAKVAWYKEFGMAGLSFVTMPLEDSIELKKWIAGKFDERALTTSAGAPVAMTPPPLPPLLAAKWNDAT
jgi:CheY-like chemotaxis protein